jgi:hypothetical protein
VRLSPRRRPTKKSNLRSGRILHARAEFCSNQSCARTTCRMVFIQPRPIPEIGCDRRSQKWRSRPVETQPFLKGMGRLGSSWRDAAQRRMRPATTSSISCSWVTSFNRSNSNLMRFAALTAFTPSFRNHRHRQRPFGIVRGSVRHDCTTRQERFEFRIVNRRRLRRPHGQKYAFRCSPQASHTFAKSTT